MTRRPAVVAGPVDSAGTPHSAYPRWSQASAPCQHSCRASTRHWPTRVHLAGKTSSRSKFDPHILEKVSGGMASFHLARHGCQAWVGTRPPSPPRPLPSPRGIDICNYNRRRDDRPGVRVKTRSPSRVPSATSRRHVELSRTRTSSWAGMRVLPARRQVAGVPLGTLSAC